MGIIRGEDGTLYVNRCFSGVVSLTDEGLRLFEGLAAQEEQEEARRLIRESRERMDWAFGLAPFSLGEPEPAQPEHPAARAERALVYVLGDNDRDEALEALEALQIDARTPLALASAAQALRAFARASAQCAHALALLRAEAAGAEASTARTVAQAEELRAAGVQPYGRRELQPTMVAAESPANSAASLRIPLEPGEAPPGARIEMGEAVIDPATGRILSYRPASPPRRYEADDLRVDSLASIGTPIGSITSGHIAAGPVAADPEAEARANCRAALEDRVRQALSMGRVSVVELGRREQALLGLQPGTTVDAAGVTLRVHIVPDERAMRVYDDGSA